MLESFEDTSGHVETDYFLALTIFPEQNEIDFHPAGIIARIYVRQQLPRGGYSRYGQSQTVGILNKLEK